MIIVVGSAAVFAFSVILKRRQKRLGVDQQTQFDAPPPYRSLFEPTDEELRETEIQNRQAELQNRIAAEQAEKTSRINAVGDHEKIWAAQTNRQNTVELLRLAADSESAVIFSQTAKSVIQVCLHEQTGILTAKDLADLLDSHLRILPQQERTSGAAFWLKEEIKRLRRESE